MVKQISLDDIASPQNLLLAWERFRTGKRRRDEVIEFERHIERNIFTLSRAIFSGRYRHADYAQFIITDPKRRVISKATVSDRIVHQAVYQLLYPIFDKQIHHHIYSSRFSKGTHAAVAASRKIIRKLHGNGRFSCWALKCDISRFYDSIDHGRLLALIEKKISCAQVMVLIKHMVGSFYANEERTAGVPIGSVTSQLFTNIYLHPFDDFVKRTLKELYYLRYADDFIFFSSSEKGLQDLIEPVRNFLSKELKLQLHPHKILLRPLRQGIDFLGYVLLPHHTVLRTTTRRRMIRKILRACKHSREHESAHQMMMSYRGMLMHANQYSLWCEMQNLSLRPEILLGESV